MSFPQVYSRGFLCTGAHLGRVSGAQSNGQGLELNKQKVNKKYHTRGEHKQHSQGPMEQEPRDFLNFALLKDSGVGFWLPFLPCRELLVVGVTTGSQKGANKANTAVIVC